tara:strand:- start:1861 stop:2295 length:435 start_codon:yes stop_codon:yes gene_type:complete
MGERYCSRTCYYKYTDRTGVNNGMWLGDNAGYWALHNWVRRILGKAKICEMCGKSRRPKNMKGHFFHWANISGKYKRDLKDWKQLCAPCHKGFDGLAKLSKEDAVLIRYKYKEGSLQRELAKEYNVGVTTIWKIVNNKPCFYST